MREKQLFYSRIYILLILFSCCTPIQGAGIRSKLVTNDTIHCMKTERINNLDNLSKSYENKFFKRFGITISSYYVVKDSLAIDLNKDSFIDTVLVLSPLPLEPIDEDYNYAIEENPKRLLVEIINDKGKSKIRNIYTDLISDIGGVISHYNGIFKTKNGFKIVHQSGAKYSWLYSMELSVALKNRISLIKISKTCSYEGIDRNISYHFNNLVLDNINIPDTLKSNCNCDKYWLELEMNGNSR